METADSLPSIARVTFLVHALVAMLVGIPLLLLPSTFGSWFGYPPFPVELEAPFRAFGALTLGLGGLTSFYGRRAGSWSQVAYIVRGEIAYLILQTVVFLFTALAGSGPALGSWLFTAVSAIVLGLFVATFVARPK